MILFLLVRSSVKVMHNDKKVLILYTGGTVGMDYTENGLEVVSGLFESQLKTMAPLANMDFDLIQYPELIDSSDINLGHWAKMVVDITNAYENYDGFVIVHGTDTMAYTASILAFALRGLNKPVILTGAQLPLVHRRSDGWGNLIDAFYAATQWDLNEVAISFNRRLFRGCRAQKVTTNRFRGFDSVGVEPLAEFGIKIQWNKQAWLKTSRFSFSPIIPKCVKVLDLSLRPGYPTEFIADTLETADIDAVILQTYGSGTIPMNNKRFVESIQNATKNGKIVVSISQVIEGRVSDDYCNSKLNSLGVVSGCDMTVEATMAKLIILHSLGMSRSGIMNAIPASLVGELTENMEDVV